MNMFCHIYCTSVCLFVYLVLPALVFVCSLLSACSHNTAYFLWLLLANVKKAFSPSVEPFSNRNNVRIDNFFNPVSILKNKVLNLLADLKLEFLSGPILNFIVILPAQGFKQCSNQGFIVNVVRRLSDYAYHFM